MKSFGARLSKLWAHANAWEKLILRLESYVINSIIPPKWPAHHCGRKQSEHRIKFQQAWKICPKMIWWISHNLFQLWLDAGPDVCAARVKRVLPLFLHQSRSRLSFGWILSAASACSVCVCLCGKGGRGRLSLELVVCGCLRRRGKIVCFSDFSDQKKKRKRKMCLQPAVVSHSVPLALMPHRRHHIVRMRCAREWCRGGTWVKY